MKLLYITKICISIWLLTLCSCNKEDYQLYDTTQQDGVFFQWNTTGVDSVYFQYGYKSIQSYTVEIPIHLMGIPKSYDRKINLSVLTDSTTMQENVHYTLDKDIVIAANEVTTTVKVNLLRANDPLLKERSVQLYIQLNSSDELLPKGQKVFRIIYDDIPLPTPIWWQTWSLGPYSFDLAIHFFKIFHTLKESNPSMYQRIIEQYGEYFEKFVGPYNGPLSTYRMTFNTEVIEPLYNYYLENPTEGVLIPKPNY